MLKKPLFWEMFVLLILVGTLNHLANLFHLYWFIYEFDSVVHFLGGAFLATFFLWLYFFSGAFSPKDKSLPKFLLVSIVGAISFAVLWEVYELLLGEALIQKTEYFYDTTLDFIMDFLGILAATFYGYIKKYES